MSPYRHPEPRPPEPESPGLWARFLVVWGTFAGKCWIVLAGLNVLALISNILWIVYPVTGHLPCCFWGLGVLNIYSLRSAYQRFKRIEQEGDPCNTPI